MKITENVKVCKPSERPKSIISNELRQFCVISSSVALRLPINQSGRDFPSFPDGREIHGRGKKAMKILQKFIFIIALTAGMTLAVSGQKNDDQKKPPVKPPPPVIVPGEKPPKDDKPKKPNASVLFWKSDSNETI